MNQTASDSERPILNIMRARAKDSREPSEGEQRASRAERADRIRNPRIHRSRGKIDKIERIIHSPFPRNLSSQFLKNPKLSAYDCIHHSTLWLGNR